MTKTKNVLLIIGYLLGAPLGGIACAAESIPATSVESAITARQQSEARAESTRFSLLPYKQNYILPITYNKTPNRRVYADLGEDPDDVELKFQLSFKVPLVKGLIAGYGDLFAGYTQQSFWQAYNSSQSSPFRETNYEPELVANFPVDYSLFGLRSRFISFALSHQSNGRSADLSRSWNRVYALAAFERGNFYCAVRPWYRIPESASDDDNPDIEKYFGYGELYALYLHKEHRFGLMLRNNLRQDNRGALLLDWSFPIPGNNLHGYLQIFSGYGESLIDYNHSNNRIGIGILVSNWL
ncbi:MAG TPA: phospholipase A [Geopsychrobacteraceae bacterium]|nr:phospholipase A [Geopsychrobacteraceae bacterium]